MEREPAAKLQSIAVSIADKDFGTRLGKVFAEAVKTIQGLGELGLGRYEDLAETGVPALELWEEVAPVIRSTVMDVNRLLSTVQQLFPEEAQGGIADLIDETLESPEEATAEGLLRRRKQEARHHIRVVTNALVNEISNLGERIRSPSVVSDRWNLLTDIQEFRGRFRTAVGDLIYLTALAFAPVSREEVVSGFAEEIRESIASRRSVTDLARLMSVHAARFAAASAGELPGLLEGLTRDLDAFGHSRAYALLRTQDKRRFVELRALFHGPGTGDAAAMKATVSELSKLTQGLSHINKRSCLIEHDRQVFACCSVALEQAEASNPERPSDAAKLFARSVSLAGDLYGRHPSLDAYLRKSKKRDLARLGGSELAFELELFRGLLVTAMAV
jgi:hypothetical protein